MAVKQAKSIAGFGLGGLFLALLLSGCGGDSSSAGTTTTVATSTPSPPGVTSPAPIDPATVTRSSERGPEVSAPVAGLVVDDDIEDPRIKANRRAALTTSPGVQPSQIRRARLD